jgi:hypothetical protein
VVVDDCDGGELLDQLRVSHGEVDEAHFGGEVVREARAALDGGQVQAELGVKGDLMGGRGRRNEANEMWRRTEEILCSQRKRKNKKETGEGSEAHRCPFFYLFLSIGIVLTAISPSLMQSLPAELVRVVRFRTWGQGWGWRLERGDQHQHKD